MCLKYQNFRIIECKFIFLEIIICSNVRLEKNLTFQLFFKYI
jgi:hypothetical protein